MRCISFVIFLTFSSCFVVLPALENVTQADEIELLERQLEYQTQAATLRMEKLKLLKAKKELGLKLEIIETKIKKLNQDYSDVVDTKTAVSASSTSEAPETSEPAEPAKVEEAPTKVASSKGADQKWVAKKAYCKAIKQHFRDIKIDEDGTFSFTLFNPLDGWSGSVKGNLKHNEAKIFDVAFGQVEIASFKAEQDGEAWNITIALREPGKTGGCDVKTVITKK